MSTIVAKFGGSSLCDGERFKKVIDIIQSDPNRRIVVPSAPGKRHSDDTKVTDLLLAYHDGKDVFGEICARYDSIISDLGLDISLSHEYAIIADALSKGATQDYIASRGEYLNAIVLANALGFEFVDATKVIKFDSEGQVLFYDSLDLIGDLTKEQHCVVPGFFGADDNGEIRVLSRGGSDVTGAMCAAACEAVMYENWTDVSGFFMADPRLVTHAINIDEISYRELRELSYMGAGVLHEDSVFPVRKRGIPVNIRNTNRPQDAGTMIIPSEELSSNTRPITGIAGKKGFAVITVEKARMNNEVGFTRKILTIMENNNISVEHVPTGIDTLSVVLSEEAIRGKIDIIMSEIESETNPDKLEIMYDLALVATVGHGMIKHTGSAAKIFTALSDANINVRMIDQGSSEINIIVGVEEEDYESAVESIYNAFMG